MSCHLGYYTLLAVQLLLYRTAEKGCVRIARNQNQMESLETEQGQGREGFLKKREKKGGFDEDG